MSPGFQLARRDQILALQSASGEYFGFHAENLQVAALDARAWEILRDRKPALYPEVEGELQQWNNERDLSTGDSHLKNKVTALTINVTQICNLRCTYCAASGDGTYGSQVAKIDTAKAEAQLAMFIPRLNEGETFTLNFLGGEPLIYPEAIEAICKKAQELASAKGILTSFRMTTNGTLVNDKAIELLTKFKIHVVVSLDGKPEDSDRARLTVSGRGASPQILRGIEKLFQVQAALGSLNVGAIFGSHNMNVLEAYNYFRAQPWDSLNLSYAVSSDDDKWSEEYARQMGLVADLAFQLGGEKELRRIYQFDNVFQILDAQTRVHNYCGAGKSLLQIDTEGRITTCNWFVNQAEEEVGRDFFLNNEKLEQEYSQPLAEKHGCGSCWARHLCGGGCMFVNKSKSGDKHQKDNTFCYRTRYIIAKGIETYGKARTQTGGQSEIHQESAS